MNKLSASQNAAHADEAPHFGEGSLLRRLEDDSPGTMAFALDCVLEGPQSFARFLEDEYQVEVRKHFNLDDSAKCRLHILKEGVLPQTESAAALERKWFVEDLQDCAVRADNLALAVYQLYWILQGDLLCQDTLMSMRVGFLYLDAYGVLEEWFKFQTTYLSALILKQTELPKIPQIVTRPGFICGGKFYRKVRNLLHKEKADDESMTWGASILALKRAASPMRIDLIEKSLEKHRSTLEKQVEENQRVQSVYHSLEECVDAAFGVVEASREGDPISPPSQFKERMPSPSSHYGWSRAEGGALGCLANMIVGEHGPTAGWHREFIGFEHFNFAQGRNPISAVYVPAVSYDIAGLVIQEAMKEPLDCDVHVVLEPMKARIITSGPPMRYHVCRMIQKHVHTVLRRRLEYQLIGGPVSEEILQKRFSRLSSAQKRWVFVSGDYSAATDNLNGHLSKYYAEAIATRLDLSDDVRSIFVKSMVGHTLHYPAEFGGWVSQQNTGQLMGSPTSFPGLCMINLATLLASWKSYTLSRYGYAATYKEMLNTLRPLVNGDDILFISPPDFLPVWREFVEAVGLSPSPGKNYVSQDFCVINSTFFQVGWTLERMRILRDEAYLESWATSATFKRRHWVGSGLIRGQARVLSDTRRPDDKVEVDFGQLRSQLSWVLDWEGSTRFEHARERCLAAWFHNMRPVLMAQERSWRLPVALGGLGLPLGGATRPQLVLANLLMKTRDTQLMTNIQVKSRTQPKATTSKQLLAELDVLVRAGAYRVVKDFRPYTIKLVPDSDPIDVEGCVWNTTPDGKTARCFDARIHDVKVSPYAVGLTHYDPEEEDSYKSIPFGDRMTRLINGFNGGPTTLDEAVSWNGATGWIGGTISRPNTRFAHEIAVPNAVVEDDSVTAQPVENSNKFDLELFTIFRQRYREDEDYVEDRKRESSLRKRARLLAHADA